MVKCCRKEQSQQAAWYGQFAQSLFMQVQRLRSEVEEAALVIGQLQTAKAALVHDKLTLAGALQRSTAALKGKHPLLDLIQTDIQIPSATAARYGSIKSIREHEATSCGKPAS